MDNQLNHRPKKKLKTKAPSINRKPTLSSLLDANIRVLAGEPKKKVAKDLQLTVPVMEDRLARLEEVSESTLPAIGLERQIISEALSEHLKPIKEALSLKALEIVKRADDLTLEKLNVTPIGDLKLPDIVKTADSYESRLARITGLEEHPDQGSGQSQDKAKRISIFVENMFAGHSEKLAKEREKNNNIKENNKQVEAEVIG